MYHEKRSDLEEQQLHLNVGLHKIHETVDQVEELQKSLSIKRIELEEKNAAANAKLKQMVSCFVMCCFSFTMETNVKPKQIESCAVLLSCVIYKNLEWVGVERKKMYT